MRHGGRAIALLMTSFVIAPLTGCSSQEDTMITEDPAVRTAVETGTHEAVDALAAQIGTVSEVEQETWTACRDAATGAETGQEFLYGVRVELEREDETAEAAFTRLVDHFEGQGWTVLGTSSDRVRFEHEGYRTGASIFVDHGYASVSGSAGCIATLEDVPAQDRPAS